MYGATIWGSDGHIWSNATGQDQAWDGRTTLTNSRMEIDGFSLLQKHHPDRKRMGKSWSGVGGLGQRTLMTIHSHINLLRVAGDLTCWLSLITGFTAATHPHRHKHLTSLGHSPRRRSAADHLYMASHTRPDHQDRRERQRRHSNWIASDLGKNGRRTYGQNRPHPRNPCQAALLQIASAPRKITSSAGGRQLRYVTSRPSSTSASRAVLVRHGAVCFIGFVNKA